MLLALVVKVMANHFGHYEGRTVEIKHQWCEMVDRAVIDWHVSSMSPLVYARLTVEREAMATLMPGEDTY